MDALATLVSVRLADQQAADVYQAVAEVAVDLVAGAGAAILTLGPPEGLRVVSHAGMPDCSRLDEAVEPARQAVTSRSLVHAIGDMSNWPRLAAAAGSAGVCDVMAEPLDLGPRCCGCLSFFATAAPLDAMDVLAAQAFAKQAAAVVANAVAFDELRRVNEQLTEGIRSRETIGLAKGILMRQEACREPEAFRILVATSQRLNRKVRDVASDLIALTEGRAELNRESGA